MQIIQRISFNPTHRAKIIKRFQKLGIKMTEVGDRKIAMLYCFDISEDDPLWPEVKEILLSSGIQPGPSRTVFTKKELTSAEWVLVQPHFLLGYPMPDLDGTWRNISFNAGKECPECGIGIEQIAPIHLKREPKSRNNNFMGTFWTYDLFARPEVFDIMKQKEIKGFETIPAIHYRLLTHLKTIKQLKVNHEQRPCIIDDNLVRDNTACGHVKYNVLTRGMMKFSRDAFSKVPDLMRTHEWFGSGHSAFQLVLGSAKFAQIYLECKWRGLYLAPLELV